MPPVPNILRFQPTNKERSPMDPEATFHTMRHAETLAERRQAACDLHNWLTKGGYPVNGWNRQQCLAECRKYMQ